MKILDKDNWPAFVKDVLYPEILVKNEAYQKATGEMVECYTTVYSAGDYLVFDLVLHKSLEMSGAQIVIDKKKIPVCFNVSEQCFVKATLGKNKAVKPTKTQPKAPITIENLQFNNGYVFGIAGIHKAETKIMQVGGLA